MTKLFQKQKRLDLSARNCYARSEHAAQCWMEKESGGTVVARIILDEKIFNLMMGRDMRKAGAMLYKHFKVHRFSKLTNDQTLQMLEILKNAIMNGEL